MKRYAIPVVVFLAMLFLAWTAFAQDKETPAQRMRRERMEQAQRYANMSEEEKAEFREQVQKKDRKIREDEEQAIKTIEEQLARLKAAIQARRPLGESRNITEEERNELNNSFADRRAALQAIVTQVGKLQYRGRQAGEDTKYMIISTDDLKPIQEAAAKEKSGQIRMLIEVLIRSKTSLNSGGGRPGTGQRPQGHLDKPSSALPRGESR